MKRDDSPKSSVVANAANMKPQLVASVAVDAVDAANKLDLSKELDDINELFMDDDDDAFKDLMF